MITIKRRCWVVSGVHVFTAGLVNAGQTLAWVRGIFSRDIVVRMDVMMIEIEGELEIIGHRVFELLAKIDNTIRAMFLFPACGNPLLEFAMTFECQVSGISP